MTSRTIVFATGNAGKMREIKAILADLDYMVISMKEANLSPEIDENGSSYEENALIKARTVSETLKNTEYADAIVMSDDSGFEVDYLDKAPGIYSARFMGEDTSYEIKNRAICDKLTGVPDEQRTARFVCAIAIVFPDGREEIARADYEGLVAHEPAGTNGFGYDPIFFVPEYGKTDAELPPEVKNEISHRAMALRAAKKFLL